MNIYLYEYTMQKSVYPDLPFLLGVIHIDVWRASQKKTLALSDNTNFGRSRLSSLKLTYPLKIGLPKRKVVCQPPIFRGYVSFTEDSFEEIIF